MFWGAGSLAVAFLLVAIFTLQHSAQADNERRNDASAHDETNALIDTALYSRVDFFGAQAIVPYPTAEARNRLAALQARYPEQPQIYLQLAQFDEKLGREEEALKEMRAFVDHEPDKLNALATFAQFSHRRAQFGAEAETLERMLQLAPLERRFEIFRDLIELAETHRLEKYLTPSFYEQVLAENPSAFGIIEQYQQKLIEQRNYPEALKLLRENKARFPEHAQEIVKDEVALLDEMGRVKEAETVYLQAFDPFWPSELSQSFYGFLERHDRFRAYGRELRAAFQRNPTDFAIAVRLLHYSKNSGEDSEDVFVQLEKARAGRHISWKQNELITITRLLLAEGYGEAASRFLYTLYLQGELKPGSALRAKVLYQLFEVLSDAGDQRLSLTRGDLKFYQDIATADPHPGIVGGILSLILSDTNPKQEFAVEEAKAVAHFNRAAAYRIFMAYKLESPTAPELAQMYLDIVRLYTAAKDFKVASETLAEFETRYQDAPQYPEVALKLADCYVATEKYSEERAVYQRILDYLGAHRRKGVPLVTDSEQAREHDEQSPTLSITAEPTTVKPSVVAHPQISNAALNYPEAATNDYSSSSGFADYLGSLTPPLSGAEVIEQTQPVSYQKVLDRYVASLARDNRTSDILALYANEIKKYADEPGLYEQMLQWLGQTNLVDEQLRVYQEALKAFPSTTWRDRLARWFLRQKRTQEFEKLSRELIAKVNDEEAERYLQNFIEGNVNAAAASFDANLYLTLYSLAHQRFPHNLNFVGGLLKFYAAHQQWQPWRALVAEYYFESQEIRNQFLSHLASHNELREYLNRAREACNQTSAESQTLLPYKLFRADAAAWLSNYEEAIDAYREMNRLYPNSPEFVERLVSFTRSLGQQNRRFLEESAAISRELAHAAPAVAEYRTRAGEILAELGNYNEARAEWEQLIPIARGDAATYLDTATIYWDYFQYDDALRTISSLRRQMNDETLYAFQVGVILEDKHRLPEALAEYVKALADPSNDADRTFESARARKRLVALSRRPGVYEQISAKFNDQRTRSNWEFIWSYLDFLNDANRWPAASTLLHQEISRSDSQPFLRRARELFQEHHETGGEVAALNRLVATGPSQRFAISYRLQLAEVYERAGQRSQSAAVLRSLVQKYPTNYGVLSESSNLYWRLGLRANSIAVLRSGMQRGIGRFHYLFGRTLASREIERQELGRAQQVLEQLHREDRLNIEVFHELAKLYVRSGNQEGLRATFQDTIEGIKKQDLNAREIQAQVAVCREEMIEAFTRLKDYSSAIEQHIEIVNRDPEDEDSVDAAINYVRRHGGGDTLLNYYRRTSQQAYKNYRWNVVLARIYEAKGDLANAAGQYEAALINQPEMTELYDSLADVHTRAKDYDSALTALHKARELSNDDVRYLKRTIDVLEKAGRYREAEAERRKLPQEELKKLTVGDQFAEAARLRGSERKRAIETYRQAFNTFAADPFRNELKSSDIAGYVQTIRDEDGLDQIMKRLWELRLRVAAEAETRDSTQAGKARSLLTTLDGAVTEAVGAIAAEKATGEELTALFKFLNEQTIEALGKLNNTNETSDALAFLRSLSRRAGFGTIEEGVLITLKDREYSRRNWPAYHNHLGVLVDFYDERGAYQRILELLEAEHLRDHLPGGFDYSRLIAINAPLVGDSTRELQALRENYQRPAGSLGQRTTAQDALVDRYFEALWEGGEAGKNELLSCAQQPIAQQLQLVNFLLRKGDKELVHLAIEKSSLPAVWKLSRNAETSLAMLEFGSSNDAYFMQALQFQAIGELIKQQPDTAKQLVGDDWFHLAYTYGRWLYSAGGAEQKAKSGALLPAMIENRPQDVAEQVRLGRWYLERKDIDPAIEHLVRAHESRSEDKTIIADLGSAFFLRGDKSKADELWNTIIGDQPSIDNCKLYLKTLTAHNLHEAARRRLRPFITARLEEAFQEERGYESSEWQDQLANFKSLMRTLAESFSEVKTEGLDRAGRPNLTREAAKAKFFRDLLVAAPHNLLLPEFLIHESLVTKNEASPFYQLLIQRSSGLSSYDRDYAYAALQEKSFDDSDLEIALDQETDYKPSEPDGARIKWEEKYLDYLIDRQDTAAARRLITTIESEIRHRYARPVWLRLSIARLEARSRNVAKAVDVLERLVGIKTGFSRGEIKRPSIERLNRAVSLLREEGCVAEAQAMPEVFYARDIALGQLEPAHFAALARIAFERGDNTSGLTWLRLLTALTVPDQKEETLATLVAMPLIKIHSADLQNTDLPAENITMDRAKALRLAAETSGEFSQFAAAIDYRQLLLTVEPDDEENRIELVRLLAANKRVDEALQSLAVIIADRSATRSLRWQAVWLAPEIIEQQPALWSTLREQVRTTAARDNEMSSALASLSLAADGQLDQALALVTEAESNNPNPYLNSLHAVIEKKRAGGADVTKSFTRALIAAGESKAWQSFSFVEDEPLEQVIALYLKQNQPRAALKLAERVSEFGPKKNANANETGNEGVTSADASARYQTLRERSETRRRTAHADLLEQLSLAAEQIGDLDRARELEQTRLALLRTDTDRRASEARMVRLRELQSGTAGERRLSLAIDQKLVSSGTGM